MPIAALFYHQGYLALIVALCNCLTITLFLFQSILCVEGRTLSTIEGLNIRHSSNKEQLTLISQTHQTNNLQNPLLISGTFNLENMCSERYVGIILKTISAEATDTSSITGKHVPRVPSD